MRESEQEADRCAVSGQTMAAERWRWRARAFDEVYTELKGRGFDAKLG
jgi:uncharacterized protein (UPF0335 family)